MFKKKIDQVLRTARERGIPYTARKAFSAICLNIGLYIRGLFREYNDYLPSIILGPERAFRMRVAIFRFMCEHNLLKNGRRSLWLGRRIRQQAFKVIYVDPGEVKYHVRRSRGFSPYIQDGDWDLKKEEFVWDSAVRQLFIDNIPAPETEQYKVMREAIKKKDWLTSRDCRTQEDLDAYFETLEDIYRELSRGRYPPSSEIKPRYRNKRRRYYPDEVCVSIDRNGEYMIEGGGGHRLSIAQMVRIDKIPVVIIGKHYLYVKSKEDWISCHP